MQAQFKLKADHLEKIKQERILKDEKELSFKPQLNNARVAEKDFFKRMERDQDRKKQKIEKLKSSIAPSFKPTINSESMPSIYYLEQSQSIVKNNLNKPKFPRIHHK